MVIDETCPCPKCGEMRLVYDGLLYWLDGPRPPRAQARKGFECSVPERYEREQLYHCAACGTEYWEDVLQTAMHLYEEGGPGRYIYDVQGKRWLPRR